MLTRFRNGKQKGPVFCVVSLAAVFSIKTAARETIFCVTIKYPCFQCYLKILIRLTIMIAYTGTSTTKHTRRLASHANVLRGSSRVPAHKQTRRTPKNVCMRG